MPRYKDPTIIKDCSIKTRKKYTSIKCPNCKTNGFIVSIFGSACGKCLYTEEGVMKSKSLDELMVCHKCNKKLKQCWKYDIPNKKKQKETGCFYCPCNPKLIISIG